MTNEEWVETLTAEQKERLYGKGLSVGRHLVFHAVGDTVRIDKENGIVYPYKMPYEEWLNLECKYFWGDDW